MGGHTEIIRMKDPTLGNVLWCGALVIGMSWPVNCLVSGPFQRKGDTLYVKVVDVG